MKNLQFLPAALFVATLLHAAPINIVDVVTDDLEYEQNSEPSIAVNPSNPQEVLITAFGDFAKPNPIFYTGDGGADWRLFEHVTTSDSSLAWAAGGSAYLAHLTGGRSAGLVVRKAESPMTGIGSFGVLGGASYMSGTGPDQPSIRAVHVNGVDRIYVSFNDTGQTAGKTATVSSSLDGGATWKRTAIERRLPGLCMDGPAARVAAQGDTVYAVFQRWNFAARTDVGGDIVLVKDTAGGAHHFMDLGTGGTGTIAAGRRIFPQGSLGQQRLGSDLCIAVEPSNPLNVYVAFATLDGPGSPIVQVVASKDGGTTWAQIYETRARAALPALAVADNGTVGLLYTAYLYGKLETHLAQTTDDFQHVSDATLSRFVDASLPASFDPFIGDFQNLLAVGNTFYGVFSASNDVSLFPARPVFLRDASLLGSRVPFSIDPFYFSTGAITSAPVMPPPPVAVDDDLVFEDVTDAFVFAALNDIDPSGDLLSVKNVGSPRHGSAFKAGTGSIVYAPDRTFTGTDSFTYTVVNSLGQTSTATVRVTAPYYRVAGNFAGLVGSSPADQASRGLLNVTVARTGSYTGMLFLAGRRYRLHGRFASDGTAIATISRAQGPITLVLSLDLTGDSGLSATISDGIFNSISIARRTVYTSTIQSAHAGRYTFASLHEPADTSSAVPHGDGWGTASVATNGIVRAVGVLADGTKFSQGSRLSNDGVWPLYALLYAGRGSVSGEVTFSDDSATDLAASSVTWIKPAVAGDVRYKGGFITSLSVIGSRYVPPTAGGPRIFLGPDGLGVAHLEGGGLLAALDTNFQISNINKFIPDLPDANGLVLALTMSNGIFVGSVSPAGNPALHFSGVIVTKANAGYGYFLTATSSGRATLSVRGP